MARRGKNIPVSKDTALTGAGECTCHGADGRKALPADTAGSRESPKKITNLPAMMENTHRGHVWDNVSCEEACLRPKDWEKYNHCSSVPGIPYTLCKRKHTAGLK